MMIVSTSHRVCTMKNIDFTDFFNVFLSGATIEGCFFLRTKKPPQRQKCCGGRRIKSGTLVAEVPLSVVKTKAGAAYTAYKMHEVGDVVPHKQDIVDLLS